MESILTSIKKLLGIAEDDTSFDVDIIIHINTVFGILRRIGVGPAAGFKINDRFTNWEDFLGEDIINLEAVKTYMYLKVQMMFDPPISSAVAEAKRMMIDELEWSISTTVDPGPTA